ncbi:unnamed protein product, partial [Brachionus calyciflorus]
MRSEWFDNYGSSELPRNFIVNEDDRLEMKLIKIKQVENFGINGLDDTSLTLGAENNEIRDNENSSSANNNENDEQTMILDMDELAIQIAPETKQQCFCVLFDRVHNIVNGRNGIECSIRQLGCPSFFITFSPAEVDWEELIGILVKIKEKRDISLNEARNEVSRERKIDLVSKDPITVARYFENRMGELLKYCFRSISGPFNPHSVVDFFWRVEFQNRGSPHIHMLTWHKDAPKYEKGDLDNNKQCAEFIDKYITVSKPFDNIVREEDCIENLAYDLKQVNIRNQIHEHKDNFKKIDSETNIRLCKYSFPWPILTETIILEPLDRDKIDENEKMKIKTNYFKIRQHLEEAYQLCKSSRVETTLDMLLSGL